MKSLLFVLSFAILQQHGIWADELTIQTAVKRFFNQSAEIRKRVDNIIKFDNDIQKDLANTLNEKISDKLKKHSAVLQTQKYFNSNKIKECETLYNSKYNSLRTKIYQKLYKNINGYYDAMKEVLTTRFQEKLKEFERRVNELYKSPDDVDFLRTKIDRVFQVISNIEIAQHNIIVTNLKYFEEEDSAQFIYDNLFVPVTDCLNTAQTRV